MNKLIITDSETGKVTEYMLDVDKNPLEGVSITVIGQNNTISIETPFRFQKSNIFIRANNTLIEAKKSTSNWPIIVQISIRNGNNQCLFIGENFTSGGTSIEMVQPNCQCTIGDDCMFSNNIQLLAADGHCIFDEENNLINWSSGISIGNHVWVGKNATILKNTLISDDSIIGANAIIARRFEESKVAIAGSPTKIIKRGIRWERTALETYRNRTLLKGTNMNQIFLIQNNKKTEIFLDELKKIYPNIKINFIGEENIIELSSSIKFSKTGDLTINVMGNSNHVQIGDNVIFNRNVAIVFQAGGPSVKANNCSLKIGARCNFNGASISFILGESDTNIFVGEDCLFANNITLTTTDNHVIYDVRSNERVNNGGDIYIGNHVWVTRDVMILNNSSVGNDSVLAARCLLTKKFECNNVILGGVPAKIIKENINWKL